MHKGEDLDCKVLCETFKYLESFFFCRISLDLNYLRSAGTSLTVITENI